MKKYAKIDSPIKRMVKGIFLAAVVLFSIMPIYWTLVNSFRSNTQIINTFRLWPEVLDFKNFSTIFQVSTLPSSFINSVVITASTMSLVAVLTMTCSFALSSYRFKAAKWIYLILISGIFVPGITTIGMTYKLLQSLNLLGTRIGIVLLYTSGRMALSVFLMTAFMRTIPDAVKEAALIDGCGPSVMLWKIVAPLARNGLIVIMILTFISVWNDYVWSMLLLPSASKRTLTVALAFFRGEFFTDNGLISACVIVGLLPILLVYVILQDRIINGLAAAAVKG